MTQESYAMFLRCSEEELQHPELSLHRHVQSSFGSIVLLHLNVDLSSAVPPRSQSGR